MVKQLISMFALSVCACGGNVQTGAPGGAEAGSGGSDGGSAGAAPASGGGGSGGTDTGRTAGAPTGGTAGSGGIVESCPDSGGPSMVLLPEGYCIDSTEVTRAQYRAWLETAPPTEGQKYRCEWNDSFEPDEQCENQILVDGNPCPPPGCPDAPQACVDWCDAYAYCKGIGKRMCGRIGGGDLDLDGEFDDPTKSQWHNACTSGGAHEYPYGDSFVEDACNDGAPPVPGVTPTGSLASCQSPNPDYAGVFDLSGNIPEWEDACGFFTEQNGYYDGRSDPCRLRGGTFGQTEEAFACRVDVAGSRTWKSGGIRCCYP